MQYYCSAKYFCMEAPANAITCAYQYAIDFMIAALTHSAKNLLFQGHNLEVGDGHILILMITSSNFTQPYLEPWQSQMPPCLSSCCSMASLLGKRGVDCKRRWLLVNSSYYMIQYFLLLLLLLQTSNNSYIIQECLLRLLGHHYYH